MSQVTITALPKVGLVQKKDESFAQFCARVAERKAQIAANARKRRAKILGKVQATADTFMANHAANLQVLSNDKRDLRLHVGLGQGAELTHADAVHYAISTHGLSGVTRQTLDSAGNVIEVSHKRSRLGEDILATLTHRFSRGFSKAKYRCKFTYGDAEFKRITQNQHLYNEMLRHGVTSKANPMAHVGAAAKMRHTENFNFLSSALSPHTREETSTPKDRREILVNGWIKDNYIDGRVSYTMTYTLRDELRKVARDTGFIKPQPEAVTPTRTPVALLPHHSGMLVYGPFERSVYNAVR